MPLVQATSANATTNVDVPATTSNMNAVYDMCIQEVKNGLTDKIAIARNVANKLDTELSQKLLLDFYASYISGKPANCVYIPNRSHVVKPSYWYNQRRAARNDQDILKKVKMHEYIMLVVSQLTKTELTFDTFIIKSNESSSYQKISDLYIAVNDLSCDMGDDLP